MHGPCGGTGLPLAGRVRKQFSTHGHTRCHGKYSARPLTRGLGVMPGSNAGGAADSATNFHPQFGFR